MVIIGRRQSKGTFGANKKRVANRSKDINRKILALALQNDKAHLMNVWVLFGAAKEEAEEFGKGVAASQKEINTKAKTGKKRG